MRIAQVSPLYESVPPRRYGGTERVVSWLSDDLARAGHEVTLFASGDSRSPGRLVSPCARSLRTDGECRDTLAPHVLEVEQVLREAEAGAFDVVHFHVEWLHYPVARRLPVPHVTTLHGRLDLREAQRLLAAFPDLPHVSISDAQRAPAPASTNWAATVHHGIPARLLPFQPGPGSYLAFLGRMSPEKRPDRAIHLARRFGMPLRIAAKVDVHDQDWFRAEVEPLLRGPGVEFLGEVGDEGKAALLGGAYALVFPIDWPEPFGLVMVESFACGTPVVAWRRGSVPEVVQDGVTGFLVDDEDGAVRALGRVAGLDRARVRREFERRFTSPRMAADYVEVYRALVGR